MKFIDLRSCKALKRDHFCNPQKCQKAHSGIVIVHHKVSGKLRHWLAGNKKREVNIVFDINFSLNAFLNAIVLCASITLYLPAHFFNLFLA